MNSKHCDCLAQTIAYKIDYNLYVKPNQFFFTSKKAMSRRYESSMLDNSSVNDIFESIGMKVLDMWDTERGDVSIQFSQRSLNNAARLERLIETPPNRLPPNWSSQLRTIVEDMEPTDFAIYGKRISLFLLNMRDKEDSHLSLPNSYIASTKPQRSQEMNISMNKAKTQVKPKSPKSPKSLKYFNIEQFDPSLSRSAFSPSPSPMKNQPQKSMYAQFPKWLPTMQNQ